MPKYEPERDRIEKAFTYHPPLQGQPVRYEAIRQNAKQLAVLMGQSCPPSRELSLAMTNLEQAVMWANAAIARHEEPCLDESRSDLPKCEPRIPKLQ